MSVFTTESLETTWKQIREFEREHFGLKFGEDFPLIAKVLQSSEHFMSLGAVTSLMAGMEMHSVAKEIQAFPGEGENKAKDWMTKASHVHGTLAEMFYLGYEMGRRSGEIQQLEDLAKKAQP